MSAGPLWWKRQPPRYVKPDRSKRVGALWTFTDPVDRVSGRSITIGTGGSIAHSSIGRVASVSGTAALNRIVLNTPWADKPGAGNFTVFARYILRSVAGFSIIGRWNTGGTPSSNDWLLGSATGIGSTISFGGAFGSNIVHAETAAGAVAGEEYFMVGRRIGTTLLVDRVHLVRGIPDEPWTSAANTSANVTTFNANAARNLKIGEIDAGAANNTSVDLLVAALLPYGLPDQVVRQLPYDIWEYFQPRRVWVPVSAVSGGEALGTLLTAGASLIAGSASGQVSATAAGVTLTATASLVAGTASGQVQATAAGVTLSAGASLIAGSAAGQVQATAAGATVAATASLVPGAASGAGSATASGASLTAASSLVPGTASGQIAATAAGATLTASASMLAGSASGGQAASAAGATIIAFASLVRGTATGPVDASAAGATIICLAQILAGAASAGAIAASSPGYRATRARPRFAATIDGLKRRRA